MADRLRAFLKDASLCVCMSICHFVSLFSPLFGLALSSLCQWRLLTLEFSGFFVSEEAAYVARESETSCQ